MRENSKFDQEFLGRLTEFLTKLKKIFTQCGEYEETVDEIEAFLHEVKIYLHVIQGTVDARVKHDNIELLEKLIKTGTRILELLDLLFGSS